MNCRYVKFSGGWPAIIGIFHKPGEMVNMIENGFGGFPLRMKLRNVAKPTNAYSTAMISQLVGDSYSGEHPIFLYNKFVVSYISTIATYNN